MTNPKFKFNKKEINQRTADGFLIIYYRHSFRIFDHPYANLKLCQPSLDVISQFQYINSQLTVPTNAAIVLTSTITNINGLSPVLEFVKKNNIKKLFFFIDDVVRLYHPLSSGVMDSSVLEKYSNDVIAGELEVIKFIANTINIDVEIYHNEANATILSKKYNINLKYFDCFSVRWAEHIANTNKSTFNVDIKYAVSCFNLRPEIYRSCIASLLCTHNNALVTLNHRYTVDSLKNNQELSLDQFTPLIKENIILNYNNILFNNTPLTLDIAFKENVYNEMFTDHQSINLEDTIVPTKHSFVNLVTETRFCSPMPNIGEKTLKPIAAFRPFIIMAAPKTLKLVKQLGFKTFDCWWDESYDEILNHHERFEAIYNLTLYILNKDKKELSELLQDMSEVLHHNYNNLKNIKNNMFNVDLT
jgi:hypothetical protein